MNIFNKESYYFLYLCKSNVYNMKSCGIYKIESKHNSKLCYIGGSRNIEKRWKQHLYFLKTNRYSYKLQSHYNKYGKSDLIFSIIELCDEQDLLLKEKLYIESINPCFNKMKYKQPKFCHFGNMRKSKQ